MEHTLIVIGGGASGLIAAITAHDMGIDTAIIEHNDRIGKKLLVTGNGRCNISNESILNHSYHSDNENFYSNALKTFNVRNTIDFFSSIGLPLITLEDGKLFPMSLQASSVLDILRFAIDDRNIPVYLNTNVLEIKKAEKHFTILTNTEENYKCSKIILCTGGKSAPKTGSNGSGYNLARAFGHNIIAPVPALVQLVLDYKNLRALSGVKFNGFADILINGASIRREFGELLFTDYGISGPPILQLSRIGAKELSTKKLITIKLDIMYNMDKFELDDFLENRFGAFNFRSTADSFTGIINKKLIPVILKEAGILNIYKPVSDLTWQEKRNIKTLLKCFEFKVINTNSFLNSQVTAGGIDTIDVDDLTMQSKIVNELYFAGEILDVDGDCGGFNLQWAWSSGYLAAKNASLK